MADATVVLIQDRIHAINQTITGMKARRYFPNALDSATLPLLISLPRRRARDATSGAHMNHSTRIFELILFVEGFLAGIPTQSAQQDAETLIDAVVAAYEARPRLELDGTTPLGGVVRARLGEDSGFEALFPDAALAVVRFPLAVTTRTPVSYAYEG